MKCSAISFIIFSLFFSFTAQNVIETSEFIVTIANSLVQSAVSDFSEWNREASLKTNVLKIVENELEKIKLSDELESRDSLVRVITTCVRSPLSSIKLLGFNPNDTIIDNVQSVVDAKFKQIKVPTCNSTETLVNDTVNLINQAFRMISAPGFNVRKTVEDNFFELIGNTLKEFPDIKTGADFKEKIDDFIAAALNNIKFPGFNPNKTLEENAAELIENALKSVAFRN